LDTVAAVAAARSNKERAATTAGAAAAIGEIIASQAAPFDVAITGALLQRIKSSVGRERGTVAGADAGCSGEEQQ